MFLFHNNSVYDPDLEHLSEIAAFLDSKLEELCAYSVSSEEADAFGYFDQIEHFLGFGLTAFQTYLLDTASCARRRKHETYKYGPKTTSGASKIQILNAAANYWKHREEWIFDDGHRQAAVDKLFDEVGYSTGVDYPLSGVLTELLTPASVSFNSLLTLVTIWRDDMIADIKNTAEQADAPRACHAL